MLIRCFWAKRKGMVYNPLLATAQQGEWGWDYPLMTRLQNLDATRRLQIALQVYNTHRFLYATPNERMNE